MAQGSRCRPSPLPAEGSAPAPTDPFPAEVFTEDRFAVCSALLESRRFVRDTAAAAGEAAGGAGPRMDRPRVPGPLRSLPPLPDLQPP